VISSRAEFERLVLPLQDALYHAALALTRREADALDLVQDTLLKAWKAAASFDRGDHLKAWLFTILRHAYLDRCRARRLEPLSFDAADETVASPAIAPVLPEESFSDGLLRALRSLSPSHQLLLLLCDVEGLSYKQISEALGMPLGSVMSGLHHARSHLRARLSSG